MYSQEKFMDLLEYYEETKGKSRLSFAQIGESRELSNAWACKVYHAWSDLGIQQIKAMLRNEWSVANIVKVGTIKGKIKNQITALENKLVKHPRLSGKDDSDCSRREMNWWDKNLTNYSIWTRQRNYLAETLHKLDEHLNSDDYDFALNVANTYQRQLKRITEEADIGNSDSRTSFKKQDLGEPHDHPIAALMQMRNIAFHAKDIPGFAEWIGERLEKIYSQYRNDGTRSEQTSEKRKG